MMSLVLYTDETSILKCKIRTGNPKFMFFLGRFMESKVAVRQ